MLPRANSMVWNLDAKDQETASWDDAEIQNPMKKYTKNGGDIGGKEEDFEMGSLSAFKSFLEVEDEEWFLTTPTPNLIPTTLNKNEMQGYRALGEITFSSNFNEGVEQNLILHSVDSSSTCDYNNIDTLSQVQNHYFLQPPLPKNGAIAGFNPMCSSELNISSFNVGCENGFLENHHDLGAICSEGFGDLTSQNQMGTPNLSLGNQFSTARLLQMPQNSGNIGLLGFAEGFGNSMFLNNRSKLLQPLDSNVASTGAQPTLFQKRAAQRKNLGTNFGALGVEIGQNFKKEVFQVNDIKSKSSKGDDFEDAKLHGSNVNNASDELTETNNQHKISEEGEDNAVTLEEENKGKKKGPPAKNLMAERRRREKLNDRLKMLRSVVPKISKMDRASILGDAIDYLKELRQKISDIQNELESTPPASSTFYPPTPTGSAFPCRAREELCPSNFASSLPCPTGGQPASVEVRIREGRAVNIHMFCSRRPGLLLSTMRALDSLGLDIQQAVISCFNGFVLDIFKAEQCKDGHDIPPEHIRAVLLDLAGF